MGNLLCLSALITSAVVNFHILSKCFKTKQELGLGNRSAVQKAATEKTTKEEKNIPPLSFEWETLLDKTQEDSAADEKNIQKKEENERKVLQTALEPKVKRTQSAAKRKNENKSHKKECQVFLSTHRLIWNEKGGEQKFYMTNKGKELEAIKICCANNLYGVRPVFSCIEPGRTAEFLIKRQEGAINKDKIVVFIAPCTNSDKSDLKNFFKHSRPLFTQNINMVGDK